ncbi:DUF4760 domain-containing protein [Dyella acidisoli]|uniref:Uncharacterized protein n=1 Tax=Dyella acidisoli TaxID=1867834 RepID=A0ABQ5XN93_9GAMM|nr:hypothetical protein [Dyella acidisoli]GLQ91978.1 hypothetical protein GCM10007901_09290 [Dyella acidisoli]
MEQKKDNVVALAWRHVIAPAAKSADPLSWILFIAFLAVFTLGVICRLGSAGAGSLHDFYMVHYGLFWYSGWFLFVLATVGPIINLTRELNEVPLVVLIGFGIFDLFVFLVISALALTQDNSVAPATALLAAICAAGMVGIGWVVQQQSSAKATRRTHTFNILMQSRLSSEFQKQIAERAKFYPSGTKVSEEDAKLYLKSGVKERKQELDTKFETDKQRSREDAIPKLVEELEAAKQQVDEKHASLKGLTYILNFYEFIGAGILLRELDERMLKETLKDIAVSLYEDTIILRTLAKERQPEAYCNLDRLIGQNWSKPDC